MGRESMPFAFSRPMQFIPHPMKMPWGGRQLAQYVSCSLPDGPVGEVWLISDHPKHRSIVQTGPAAGMTLHELMTHHAIDMLGVECSRWPLLIKLLDARANLSIQVHPDDEHAKRWAPNEGGKSEAWYVLESSPQGCIYLDTKRGIDHNHLQKELAQGTLPLCLQQYHPQPGECYNVPAGTIHALGAGVVVLEVQQSSNATFRLYDWGRVDEQGHPRPLHLQAALACLRFNPLGAGLGAPQRLSAGCEGLVATPYFSIQRWSAGSHQWSGPSFIFSLSGPPLTVHEVMITNYAITFLPAAAAPIELNLTASQQLLHIGLPNNK